MSKIFSLALRIPIRHTLASFSNCLTLNVHSKEKILISISGGQDSTCLALFVLLYKELFLLNKVSTIGFLHCQHHWSPLSLRMANHLDLWVSQLGKLGLKLNFYSSIPVYPISSEASGRRWRLKLLKCLSNKYDYHLNLTGHTVNDELETFLMEILVRGFLNPIRTNYINNIKINKPFYCMSRYEIAKICINWQIPVFSDSSNMDLLFTRARFRNELFNILKCLYNPQIENTLIQIIQTKTREKVDYFFTYKNSYTFIYLSNNKIILNRSQINQLPKITRYRLWRNCFQILGTFDIGFYWIEKCRLYSQLKTTFSFCLINNIELKGIQNQLILSKVKN